MNSDLTDIKLDHYNLTPRRAVAVSALIYLIPTIGLLFFGYQSHDVIIGTFVVIMIPFSVATYSAIRFARLWSAYWRATLALIMFSLVIHQVFQLHEGTYPILGEGGMIYPLAELWVLGAIGLALVLLPIVYYITRYKRESKA